MGAEVARQAQQRPQPAGGVGGPTLGREGPQQRGERGQLDREVGALQRPVGVGVEQRLVGPIPGDLSQPAQRLGAALEVCLGLGLGDGRLAEQVDGEGLAAPPHPAQVAGRVGDVAPGDELPGEKRGRRPAHQPVGGERQPRRSAGAQPSQAERQPLALDLPHERPQVGSPVAGPAAGGGHVDEAEHR